MTDEELEVKFDELEAVAGRVKREVQGFGDAPDVEGHGGFRYRYGGCFRVSPAGGDICVRHYRPEVVAAKRVTACIVVGHIEDLPAVMTVEDVAGRMREWARLTTPVDPPGFSDPTNPGRFTDRSADGSR